MSDPTGYAEGYADGKRDARRERTARNQELTLENERLQARIAELEAAVEHVRSFLDDAATSVRAAEQELEGLGR